MPAYTARLIDLINDGFDVGLTADDYQIFDEAHREVLNRRILDHYALYEIGQETPELFRFMLNRRMREIMPYYNKMYDSEKIVFDPLSTVDLSDNTTTDNTVNSNQSATNNNSNSTSSKSRVTNSELPQVHLQTNEDYASSGADSVADTTVTGDGTSTTTGTDTANGTVSHEVTGRQGPAATLLMNYRASLLNIDMMVVAQCVDLFMGLWQTNDNYSHERF